jgi:hypothetical protein
MARAYLVGVGAFVLSSAWLALRDHHRIATLDDWRILNDLFSMPLGAWLFRHQNGHLVPATLALLYLDYTLLSGRMQLLVWAALACAGLAAWVLGHALLRSRELPAGLRQALAGFAVFALFWAFGSFELLWGMNQGSVLAILWLCLALASLARGLEAGASSGWLVGAGAAAALATFSHGMGFAAWMALLGSALLTGSRARVAAAYTLAAGASFALYGAALGAAEFHPVGALENGLRRPADLFRFVTAFLGSPVARTTEGLGWEPFDASVVAGGIGILAAAALLAAALRRRDRLCPPERIGLGLVLFAAAGSLMAGLTRLGLGFGRVDRFATWGTLFWLGLLTAAVSLPALRSSPRRLRAALLLLGLLSLAMLPGFVQARAGHLARDRALEAAASALWLGIENDAVARRLMPLQPELIPPVAARLARDRRNLFADPRAGLPGSRLDEQFRAAEPGRCRGALGPLRPIPARNRRAAELRGWAVDVARKEPPRYVVIADARGRIRGLGSLGGPSRIEPGAWRFVAYLADPDPTASYSAFGILPDEGVACALGSFAEVGRTREK